MRSAIRYVLGPLLATLALAVCQAVAAPPDLFAQFLATPAHQRNVIDAAAHTLVFQHHPCTGAKLDILEGYALYEPPAFDAAGAIVSGSWKQSVSESGCGSRRLLNVIVRIKGAHAVLMTPMLPGTTLTDPALQAEGVKATMALIAESPDAREPTPCAVGYVSNTEYIGRQAPAAPQPRSKRWRERWTLTSCTKRVELPVTFTPTAAGTTVTAGPASEMKVSPAN